MTPSARTHSPTEALPLKGMLAPDPVLFTVTAFILAVGIVMVTSAGYIIASGKFADGFYFTKKQGLSMAGGVLVMYVVSLIKPVFWKKAAAPLMALSTLLLILVLIPGIGVELGGSRRWIRLPMGFFFQPSEFAKFALLIFISASLAKKGPAIRDFSVGFLPHLIAIAAMVGLVILQPDFGTGVVITVVSFLVLFVAGVRIRHLLATAVFCLPLLIQIAVSAPYRMSRWKSFLDPWADPFNAGFQIIQSLVAFGCGGLFGVGIGKGIQKLFYLPQPHTDFIFAVVGEELGLMGVILLILLFCALVGRGISVAVRAKDSFNKFLAFGISSLIGLQAAVNMAVCMGMLPTKGLPLPLVSLGGTSLITTLWGLGILMAIAKTEQPRSERARS